jgi:hypothetical protein
MLVNGWTFAAGRIDIGRQQQNQQEYLYKSPNMINTALRLFRFVN